MSKTDYLEGRLLDDLFGLAAYAPPATFYLGISSALADDAGAGFTEPGGSTGYSRVALAAGGANWSRAGAVVSSAVPVSFVLPDSVADFVVRQLGIFDAISAGNLLALAPTSPEVTIAPGGSMSFPAGAITWSED